MDPSGGATSHAERTGRRLNCAIEATGLSKSFGKVVAVEALELCIYPGEIYGFLGLNGAGKTTTIRALLGMIHPSQGCVRVLGQRVGPAGRGPWRSVGHLVEAPSAYPELTIRENLDIARRLHAISDRGSVSRVIEHLDLGRYADRRTGSLSTGSLQRLALARALLHDPEVLILDEPANGLDPAGVVEIRQLLSQLATDKGVTVFMSSHILTEVDRLATRIGIIHRGRLLEELDAGTLSDAGKLRVQVRPQTLAIAIDTIERAGFKASVEADSAALALDDPRALSAPEQIVTLLVNAGAPPIRLGVERESLEDHFLRLTGGRL
jgi:ABC-2 type transport system ATP-binding protein